MRWIVACGGRVGNAGDWMLDGGCSILDTGYWIMIWDDVDGLKGLKGRNGFD